MDKIIKLVKATRTFLSGLDLDEFRIARSEPYDVDRISGRLRLLFARRRFYTSRDGNTTIAYKKINGEPVVVATYIKTTPPRRMIRNDT